MTSKILNSMMRCWNLIASNTINFNLYFDWLSFFAIKRSISLKCIRKSIQNASKKKHGPMNIDKQQFCVPNRAYWFNDCWIKNTMYPMPENRLYGVLCGWCHRYHRWNTKWFEKGFYLLHSLRQPITHSRKCRLYHCSMSICPCLRSFKTDATATKIIVERKNICINNDGHFASKWADRLARSYTISVSFRNPFERDENKNKKKIELNINN